MNKRSLLINESIRNALGCGLATSELGRNTGMEGDRYKSLKLLESRFKSGEKPNDYQSALSGYIQVVRNRVGAVTQLYTQYVLSEEASASPLCPK